MLYTVTSHLKIHKTNLQNRQNRSQSMVYSYLGITNPVCIERTTTTPFLYRVGVLIIFWGGSKVGKIILGRKKRLQKWKESNPSEQQMFVGSESKSE